MPITLNTLLVQAQVPLPEVRLLRHKDRNAAKGRGPYELWRDDRPKFELYQSSQRIKNEPRLTGTFWASFVVTPAPYMSAAKAT